MIAINKLFARFHKMSKDEETGYLLYQHLPPFLRAGEEIYLAHYDISGIQAYIFSQISIYTSKEEIAERSKYIENLTLRIAKYLLTQFPGKANVLTSSSGNILCSFAGTLQEGKIREVSDHVQRAVFATTEGRLEIYYGLARAIAVEGKIPEGTRSASALCWEDLQRQKFHCTNLLRTDFQKDILDEIKVNAGISAEDKETVRKSIQDERKVYVAIKFDFDNLGAFFHSLNSFDESRAASEALEEIIKHCFDGINGVRPIFTGGDDIFAITELKRCYIVLEQMYERIKHSIDVSPAMEKFRGENFGLSGGCSFIQSSYGEVPLIFFMEESEEALSEAKRIPGKRSIVFWNDNLKRELSDAEEVDPAELDGVFNWDQIRVLAKVQSADRRWIEEMDPRSQDSTMLRLRDKIINDYCHHRNHFLNQEEIMVLRGKKK